MRVGNLTGWPPFPPSGNGSPERVDWTLQGCEYVSRTARHPAHLLVTIRCDQQNYTTVYWHTSESILLRLMASVRHCAGMSMSKICDIELLELTPSTS